VGEDARRPERHGGVGEEDRDALLRRHHIEAEDAREPESEHGEERQARKVALLVVGQHSASLEEHVRHAHDRGRQPSDGDRGADRDEPPEAGSAPREEAHRQVHAGEEEGWIAHVVRGEGGEDERAGEQERRSAPPAAVEARVDGQRNERQILDGDDLQVAELPEAERAKVYRKPAASAAISSSVQYRT